MGIALESGFPLLSLLAALPAILSLLFVFAALFLLLEAQAARFTVLATVAVAVWAVGFAFTMKATGPEEALFWIRVSTAGLLLLPALCYLFNASLVHPAGLSRPRVLGLLALAAVFETLHWLRPLFVQGVERHSWGYFPRYGLVFLAFLAWFVVTFWVILRDTWRHYRQAPKGPVRSRDRALLVAWFFCFCGGWDILIGFGVSLPPVSYVPVTLFLLCAFVLLLRQGKIEFLEHWSLASVLQSTSDSIFLVHPEGALSAVDNRTAALLGYENPKDLRGRPINELFNDDTPLFCPETIQRISSTKRPESLQLDLKTPGGPAVPLRVRLSGIFDRKGRLLGLVAIGRDLREEIEKTEQIRQANRALQEKVAEVEERTLELSRTNCELEQSQAILKSVLSDMEASQKKLQEAYSRLAEADRAKDAFLASVSHEFRTPLTSIRSYSELLLSYPDEPEETRREFLRIILQKSERLTRLVNDLLDLARIESGRQIWRDEELDLAGILNSVRQSFSALTAGKALSVTVRVDRDLPRVFADRDRMFQVVSNLMANAVKFTPCGGTIELGAEAVKIEDGRPGSTRVRVWVADTGCGIAAADLDRIFEKFHQAGDTLTGKPEGTGLGLAISREIVQHYGGTIWAESAPGKGSRLVLLLPALPERDVSEAGRGRERNRGHEEATTQEASSANKSTLSL